MGRNGDVSATLPRLCLVADGFAAGRRDLDARAVQARAAELVAAGLRWVWLRDVHAGAPAFDAAARRLAERLRALAPDVTLSVGAHAATASALDAVLHVGTRGGGADAAGARGFGVSAHTPAEVADAALAGAAYATLSPIFPTQSHPAVTPLGLDALRAVSAASSVPVLALGGLTPDGARRARDAGAWGVAVLSDLLRAPRPVWRLDQYAAALD